MDMNVCVTARTSPLTPESWLERSLICSYTDIVMDDCPCFRFLPSFVGI